MKIESQKIVLREIETSLVVVQEVKYFIPARGHATERFSMPTLFYRARNPKPSTCASIEYDNGGTAGEEEIGNVEAERLVGRLSYIPPGSVTSYRALAHDEVSRFICCMIKQEALDFIANNALLDMPAALDIRCFDIERSMYIMAKEFADTRSDTPALINALGQCVAVHLVRHFKKGLRECIPSSVGGVNSLVRAATEFIETHLLDVPSPSEVAIKIGSSEAYLCRIFKRDTGQTLHRFLEDARIARARALLAQTRLPLKAISYDLGYAHASAFSAAFRRALGITPTEYRHQFEGLVPRTGAQGSA